jgi:hypothetical protein
LDATVEEENAISAIKLATKQQGYEKEREREEPRPEKERG